MPPDTAWMDALPDVAMPGQVAATGGPASFPIVAPHPAPDNSGTTTNLSDEDYAKFMAGRAPPAGAGKADTAWMDALPDVALPSQAASTKAATPSQPPMTAADVPSVLAGSTAAALDALPRGLVGNSTVNYVDAATQTPLRMLYGKMPQPPGDTAPPQNGFRFAGPLTAFEEGRQSAETRHNALADKYPVASVGGELMGGAAGGAMAAPALAWEAAPAAAPLLTKLGNAGSYVARNAGFGGAMSELSGGDPTTGAVVGGALPAAHVLGSATVAQPISWLYNKVAPLWSQGAREQSVGNVLNRTVGGSPVQTSPVGPLDLGAATNNADVAAKVDIAPGYNAGADAALKQGQQSAVTNQISRIGTPAAGADASTAGTNAIRDLSKLSRQREGELWNAPALTDFLFQTGGLKQSAQSAVNAIQRDDPGLMLGMVGPIRDAVGGITGLPDHANLQNINSYIGVLKSVARRPPPDNPRAGALAARILDSVGKGLDDTVAASGAPSTVQTAYQTARDFTRTRAGIFGSQDMRSVMSKNPTGAFTADASEAMKRFFNFSNGSGEGPANIKQLTDFADEIKQAWVGSGDKFNQLSDSRDALRDAARSYVASALTDAARVNPGENLNPKLMQDFLRKNGDWMRSSGLFSGSQIKAVDDLMGYAEMLRRPGELLQQVNSATQPRAIREKTFIDQIMAPWMRHAATVSATIAGGAHGAIEAGVGSLAGVGFGHAVTHAETAMRELMSQALLDPRVAQDLMMKASGGNRMLMSPGARKIVDTMRAAVGADMAPQMIGKLASPATSEVGR